ncbi:copper transporter 1-like [Papaver somniferum]|uniref:copper transporter 1-like n=1 Tax=Papaver somniferum TaxID=3469 RepID=UPI000E701CAD|nr:copper transporter 1-like [Papaver somniferum]
MDGMGGGNSTKEYMNMSMQMTFYWGMASEILFKGWSGHQTGMYVLALVIIFALAMLVEFLAYTDFVKFGLTPIALRILLAMKHGIRVGLLYLVMLAVMTFNVGVLIAAVSGHALGFFFSGSRTISPVNPEGAGA